MSTIKLHFVSDYFKNTELARMYGVSEATVRNWVKSSKEGRLGLRIVDRAGHNYVAKDISNLPIIEELIKQNRKYRNTQRTSLQRERSNHRSSSQTRHQRINSQYS